LPGIVAAQEDPMKVTRLNHAGINVHGKQDETLKFYRELLGIGTAERDEIASLVPGYWLELPNAQVHVVDAETDGTRNTWPMGTHLSYFVEDLEGAIQELDEREVEYLRFKHVVWFKDPAGNTVEIQQDPALSP
jgi:catechol 2,3-dioxygenase-like lactoylglutathione lyase family enzyme